MIQEIVLRNRHGAVLTVALARRPPWHGTPRCGRPFVSELAPGNPRHLRDPSCMCSTQPADWIWAKRSSAVGSIAAPSTRPRTMSSTAARCSAVIRGRCKLRLVPRWAGPSGSRHDGCACTAITKYVSKSTVHFAACMGCKRPPQNTDTAARLQWS